MIGETYHHTGATSRWLLRHQQIPKAYLGVRPESRDGESELLAVDEGEVVIPETTLEVAVIP